MGHLNLFKQYLVVRTRREFLMGAAATAVLGSAGLIEGCTDGSESSTATPPRGVRVVSGRMASVHMSSPVGWAIAWPRLPAEGVVFCLHGYAENHRFAFDQIHVPDVVAASQVPLVVAAVDGGKDSYWHRRADGTDALTMLLDEFVPLVDQQLPAPLPRALLGWSMGGYGALLAAEQAPDQFRAVAVASPALWTSADTTAPGAFDGPSDYRQHDVFARVGRLGGLTVRVDCGTGDPFYRAAKSFVAGLPPGHEGTFGPGSHNSAYWRTVAPAEIATIAGVLKPI